jgi:glycosyltransferase involved in cell wall biosynthesis
MTRIVALLPFCDEARYLPGYFANLRGRVDGVVALDDGSRDGGAEFVAARPETRRLLRNDADGKAGWDEAANRRALVTAGHELGADWFLALDADERLEDGFWRDLDRLVAGAERDGVLACSFRLRELWHAPDRYRVDGLWGRKTKAAFFRNLGDEHVFDDAAWHGEWVPMQCWGTPACCAISYDLYHLKMIRAEDRAARRALYEGLDPDNAFQPIGYAYLTDADGLETVAIEPGREYRDV